MFSSGFFLAVYILLAIPPLVWWWKRPTGRANTSMSAPTNGRQLRFMMMATLWLLVVALTVWAFAVKYHNARENERLWRDLGEVGGVRGRPISWGQSLRFRGSMVSDQTFLEVMERVRTRHRIWKLDLSGQPIGDASLDVVGRLEGLKYLDLHGTNIGDKGLSRLRGLEPTYIDLSDTNVSDAGLVHLSDLTDLSAWNPSGYLNLSGTNIEGSGVEHLANIKNLRYLDLSRTRITDQAIDDLKQLSGIVELHLEETSVSKDAVEGLREALPDASIYWTPTTPTP